MTKVKEDKIALEEVQKNLVENQNLLEKQKLDYDETVTDKENCILKVSQ